MTCLQAAINAGADAVYLGVDVFNMRCGPSAHRGECRQPCRRFYRVQEIREDAHSTATFDAAGHTIFSTHDLFSLPFLDRLITAMVSDTFCQPMLGVRHSGLLWCQAPVEQLVWH